MGFQKYCDSQIMPLRDESCRGISPQHNSRRDIPIHEDFPYDTERLKCYELSNCKISWDSRLLTGLTRLTTEGRLIKF